MVNGIRGGPAGSSARCPPPPAPRPPPGPLAAVVAAAALLAGPLPGGPAARATPPETAIERPARCSRAQLDEFKDVRANFSLEVGQGGGICMGLPGAPTSLARMQMIT